MAQDLSFATTGVSAAGAVGATMALQAEPMDLDAQRALSNAARKPVCTIHLAALPDAGVGSPHAFVLLRASLFLDRFFPADVCAYSRQHCPAAAV
eukprot:7263113-Prymnesium_polylepis.1